jgi:hypothetical protein
MPNANHSRFAAIVLLFVIAMIPAPNANARDHSCQVSTREDHLFIIFYDVYPDGNWGKLIWQGNLKFGQQVKLKSAFGRFFYRYQTNPNARNDLINGVIRFCKNGESIGLP